MELYDAHIDTLCKLNEIAKKYNCKIGFYINSVSGEDLLDEDFLMKQYNISKEIAKDILDNTSHSVEGNGTQYCFALIDSNGKHHSINYFTIDYVMILDDDMVHSLLPETIKFEENNCDSFDGNRCYFYDAARWQSIIGFDTIDKSQINIYREGIMLREFSYLVCDFLCEPRIEKVY